MFICRKKYIYGNQEQWSVGDSTATFNCRLNHKIYTTQIVQYHSQVFFYWCSNTTALLGVLLNNHKKTRTHKKHKNGGSKCVFVGSWKLPSAPRYTRPRFSWEDSDVRHLQFQWRVPRHFGYHHDVPDTTRHDPTFTFIEGYIGW